MQSPDFLSDPNGTIRRRKPPSYRRNDGLIKCGYDNTSQSGEDGIIKRLFELIPLQNGKRWCVDVGAWDGKHLSNTFSLLCGSESEWNGVLLEADARKFQQLKELHDPLNNTCLNVTVSCLKNSTQSLSYVLKHLTPKTFPKNFDFLCIDIDGADYWCFHDVLNSTLRAKVVCVEFNPTMPHDLIYIQPRDDNIRNGSSLPALVELASQFNYQLVECTCYNAFFVDGDLYEEYVKSEIPFEPSIETLHEVTMGTTLYQLYDGTLKISGCKKLLWHRIPIKEDDIQVLKKEKDRSFPFAPGTSSVAANPVASVENEVELFQSISIDMSPYVVSGPSDEKKKCSQAILDQLRADGFALVRGTGMSQKICENAIQWTNNFLQEAPEAVRRSCLTKDRARRGYSPQNAENFASLIGAKGPNDLVQKFRIGPEEKNGESSALMQPNAWPSEDVWGKGSAEFQKAVHNYYEKMCEVANSIVVAICDGLNDSDSSSIMSSMEALSIGTESHTSILTLLGYRKGARHQGCKKPLVAAHTDVGVVTVLLFDGGDCATLQRADGDRWVDVKLPTIVPADPVFVVNIGDCLSDLCDGKLPSTLHRVMPRSGSTNSPRNCLALFVGFKPDQTLNIKGESMTYEEWRRLRIAKAQGKL